MAVDLEVAIRDAVVRRLRDDVGMTALVPAERIHGRKVKPDEAKPFTRYGTPILTPFRGSCFSGTGGEITLHAFGRGPDETEAANIAAYMVALLDGLHIPLAGEQYVQLHWTGGQTDPDADEPTDWHAYRTFEVAAVA